MKALSKVGEVISLLLETSERASISSADKGRLIIEAAFLL
jgi:hypothetical protein